MKRREKQTNGVIKCYFYVCIGDTVSDIWKTKCIVYEHTSIIFLNYESACSLTFWALFAVLTGWANYIGLFWNANVKTFEILYFWSFYHTMVMTNGSNRASSKTNAYFRYLINFGFVLFKETWVSHLLLLVN